MKFEFRALNIEQVKKIATWRMSIRSRYIDMHAYFESYSMEGKPLRGPDNCLGFAVMQDETLLGLFEYYEKEENFEIGLAIAPKWRGKGLGYTFVSEGIAYGRTLFPGASTVYLEVSRFNKAALKIYRKIGFEECGRHNRFICMTKAL